MADENVFSGLRVVDMASWIAGPGATTILGEFGADVIKVEPPGHGDGYRMLYKIPPHPRAETNYAWNLTNRNKRGLALNLKSKRAGDVVKRLAEWADVFVTNYPPPVRERLKVTYEDVARHNPRLIYADVTGFGDRGPDADAPGFDLTAYWARGGLLAMMHDAGSPPTLAPSGSGDHATAVGLYASIVTALYRRERTGKGGHVTASLIAEGAWSAGVYVQAALCGAKFYPAHDRLKPSSALLNPYQTSDGVWIMLVARDQEWPGLTAMIGQPTLLDDERFADPSSRAAHSAELAVILDRAFRSAPVAHWRERLSHARITFGVVQTPEQVIEDPALLSNDVIVPIEGGGEKLSRTLSSPIHLHGVEKVRARRAPEVGEHDDELLAELGFTREEVDALRASGAVPPPSARLRRAA
jgi:crotonobetainyl-CoA:carnitine CoA-transferase CaiB-like acyl-CoA transferase